eukprot:1861694-Rhodomonas_salina.1
MTRNKRRMFPNVRHTRGQVLRLAYRRAGAGDTGPYVVSVYAGHSIKVTVTCPDGTSALRFQITRTRNVGTKCT